MFMNERENKKYLKAIGNNIKALRNELKLSYRSLAQKCDVDHSQISKIEKGYVSFEILTLLELAKGLEVHPKKLLEIDWREKHNEYYV